MSNDVRIHPAYAEEFRCIGPACEDTCCKIWTVPVDRAAWEKYQVLPAGPLRILTDSNILRSPESAEMLNGTGSADKKPFATIRMNEAHECPFLTGESLCRIQSELGHELLPDACATYPRIIHSRIARFEEQALTFSCPEAVRLVMLNENLPLRAARPEAEISGMKEAAGKASLLAHFQPIRALVLKLVRARMYPLWQRLFLLDLLCRRLGAVERSELERAVPVFMEAFEQAIETGSLRASMESLPANPASQLDVVLRLAGLMLHKSNVTPRFAECVQAFTAGIGNGPGATLESLTARYTESHDHYYAPFFEHRPHIMENLLINTIFRCGFPFRREEAGTGGMARESALLIAQFVLMRGLLIGVAGHYRNAFSELHLVHTVQSASKHFEHHPEFLTMAHKLLVESRMDDPRGLGILLRNVGMKRDTSDSIQTFPTMYAEAQPNPIFTTGD